MKRYFLLLLALTLAPPLLAQTPSGEPLGWPESFGSEIFSFHATEGEQLIFGNISLGVQFVDVDENSSKFQEFRDTPDGLVLPYAWLYGEGTYLYWVTAKDVGQRDQQFHFFVERGPVSVDFDYKQIPHNFGNDARMLFAYQGNGTYAISDALQAYHQNALEQQRAVRPAGINYAFLKELVTPSISQSAYFDTGLLRERRDLRISAGENWNADFRYYSELRSGTRPDGTSFGFGNVVETPEPIDFLTTDLSASLEVPLSMGLVTGMVGLNEFTNHIPSETFDNPFRITDSTDPSAYTAPGAGSIAGPVRGRIALSPDNKAMTYGVGLLLRLPGDSRLTADLSKSTWEQEAAFLPFTTNTAITVPFDATNPANLPESRLDGDIDVTNINLRFVTRPVEGLSLQARYRVHDTDNNTPRVEFEHGYVRFDAVWEEIPRISVPFGNETDQFDLSAAFDFGLADIEAGYTRKDRDLTYREVGETSDDLYNVAANVRPWSWFSLRAMYETGSRSYDEYDTEAGEGASHLEPEGIATQPGLRMFDIAEKDMDRLSALIVVNPWDDFGLTARYIDTEDDYKKSEFGLRYAKGDSWSVDLDWSRGDNLSLYAFVGQESYETYLVGRQSGATPSTNPLDDWYSTITDDVDSYGLGGTWTVKPDEMFVKFFYRNQRIAGYNDLYSPPGGTPNIAVPIAQFDDTDFETLSAELAFKLRQHWGFAIGGWLESYDINDLATVGLSNYMPGGFFLAGNDLGYQGDVIYVRASFRD